MSNVSSNDNFIDPRDVASEAADYESDIETKQEEIEETEEEINDLEVEIEDSEDDDVTDLEDKLADLRLTLANLNCEKDELEEESQSIMELNSDCEDYARGESLINEDYWVTYVQQMAEDIDGINTSNWPYNCIDWEQAATDLAMDYTTITFEGQDFYIRS